MKTKDQVTTEFKADLAELLRKYSRPIPGDWDAEIILGQKSHSYYSEYWIEVCIPTLFDEAGNETREYTEINLGERFSP